MDERREGMGRVYERLEQHGERLAALESTTRGMDGKLDRVLEKLSVTREQVAEGKGKMAILWAGAIAGASALGHTLISVFQQKGQ